ncbi:MAG: alkaline phosphatase family protein [Kiloniellales bacterium]
MTRSGPVIAIGLDAAEASLIEDWAAAGKLPTLARLKAAGAYGRVEGTQFNPSEVAWPILLTGCWPETTGYWQNVRFHAERYGISRGAYDYGAALPFYALGSRARVAVFDLPDVPLSDKVSGLQMLAWGSHSPCTPAVSDPPGLYAEIKQAHGPHPAFQRDHARIWKRGSMRRLHRRLLEGIALRGRVCADLLRRERWDLFLTAFGETHGAGHYFWHFNRPEHPWSRAFAGMMEDEAPLLAIYAAVDRAVGEILQAAPADARIVIFSQEGMETSNLDNANMAMLPELLYRHSFPGRVGLAADGGPAGSPPPAPKLRPLNLGWVRSVWASKADPNPLRRLLRKSLLMELGDRVERLLGEASGPQYPYRFRPYFSPAMWYSRDWPRMRAFALPAVGDDGHVRINLQGRERDGLVPQADYDALCDEVRGCLLALEDPRTGRRPVHEVVRTREGAAVLDEGGLQGDLVVLWDNAAVYDVVDHPGLGRIGPFAPRRSGGHHRNGFFIAQGPGLPAGAELEGTKLVDLAPMILQLTGEPAPNRMDGRSPPPM